MGLTTAQGSEKPSSVDDPSSSQVVRMFAVVPPDSLAITPPSSFALLNVHEDASIDSRPCREGCSSEIAPDPVSGAITVGDRTHTIKV